MKLNAVIDIETEASASDAILAIESAIYNAVDGLEIRSTYTHSSDPVTEISVTVEEWSA